MKGAGVFFGPRRNNMVNFQAEKRLPTQFALPQKLTMELRNRHLANTRRSDRLADKTNAVTDDHYDDLDDIGSISPSEARRSVVLLYLVFGVLAFPL